MTFKEWFVDMFNRKSRINRKSEIFSALRGIDLIVAHGERLGIIGPNGAGKTTLMKCIAGIYTPSAGAISVKGNITPLIDISAGFNPELTGRDNIYLHAAIRGMTRAEIRNREEEIITFADIGEFIDIPMKYYSSGMVSRLAFSVATSVNPEILILDEVFSPGDSQFVKKARNRIREIIDFAHIMLFVSHNETLIRDICTRVIWLDRGGIVADGDPGDVFKYYEANVHLSAAKEIFFLRKIDKSSYSTLQNIEYVNCSNSIATLDVDLRTKGILKYDSVKKPLLSVVVVANESQEWERCVRSILIQPYDNIELIVINTSLKKGNITNLNSYIDTIDVWENLSGADSTRAIQDGLKISRGSVVHVLYGCDTLDDFAYSEYLITKVKDEEIPYLLDYNLILKNGSIVNRPMPIFHPMLYRALLIPRLIYEQLDFKSIQEFVTYLINNHKRVGFPIMYSGIFLSDNQDYSEAETAEYWSFGMPPEIRNQLLNDIRGGCEGTVFLKISMEKRQIVLDMVAETFRSYVNSLPDRSLVFESSRKASDLFFNSQTPVEKPYPDNARVPIEHPLLHVVDKYIEDKQGWSVFVPDCVFRNWLAFFGTKGLVLYGADRSSHIHRVEDAYRSAGYDVGGLQQVDPVQYVNTREFDIVFTALYQAFYRDLSVYFSKMTSFVAPGKYIFVGYWNFEGAMQRRINRAVNPQFMSALNPDAMDKKKIAGWLSDFDIVEEGYLGGISIFPSNESRDTEQRSILCRLKRELFFARHVFNTPSSESSVFGYVVARRHKKYL